MRNKLALMMVLIVAIMVFTGAAAFAAEKCCPTQAATVSCCQCECDKCECEKCCSDCKCTECCADCKCKTCACTDCKGCQKACENCASKDCTGCQKVEKADGCKQSACTKAECGK